MTEEELKKKLSEDGGYYPKSTFMIQMLRSLGGSFVYILQSPFDFIKNKKDYGLKEAARKLYVAEKFYFHQLGFTALWFLLTPFTTTKFRIKLSNLQTQDHAYFLCEYCPKFKDALKFDNKK